MASTDNYSAAPNDISVVYLHFEPCREFKLTSELKYVYFVYYREQLLVIIVKKVHQHLKLTMSIYTLAYQ